MGDVEESSRVKISLQLVCSGHQETQSCQATGFLPSSHPAFETRRCENQHSAVLLPHVTQPAASSTLCFLLLVNDEETSS